MRIRYAILDKDKKIVPCELYELQESQRVEFDKINNVMISTVFLGVNHGFLEQDLWFETMIFGGEHHMRQWRCETWDEAVVQHQNAVKLVEETRSS